MPEAAIFAFRSLVRRTMADPALDDDAKAETLLRAVTQVTNPAWREAFLCPHCHRLLAFRLGSDDEATVTWTFEEGDFARFNDGEVRPLHAPDWRT